MLAYLRERVQEMLDQAGEIILVTYGAAGLQADWLPVQTQQIKIYALVPGTSEHLFNVESNPHVLIFANDWQARGQARTIDDEDHPPDIELARRPGACWCKIMEITPTQFLIGRNDGWGYRETIDL